MTKPDCRRRTAKHLHSSQNSPGETNSHKCNTPRLRYPLEFCGTNTFSFHFKKSHSKRLNLLLDACWKLPLPRSIPPTKLDRLHSLFPRETLQMLPSFILWYSYTNMNPFFYTGLSSHIHNPRSTQITIKMEK